MTNYAQILGRLSQEPRFSHSIYGEDFYSFFIESERLSGRTDMIPCMAAERHLKQLSEEKELLYCGQIRSYNKLVDGANRLDIRLFVKEIYEEEAEESLNSVSLTGYICKKPTYRRTPFGREITDMLVAVNRAYNKSDYIPVITWGRNARLVNKMEIGDRIRLQGRLQSRDYEKILGNNERICRTAYEVSVREIEKTED